MTESNDAKRRLEDAILRNASREELHQLRNDYLGTLDLTGPTIPPPTAEEMEATLEEALARVKAAEKRAEYLEQQLDTERKTVAMFRSMQDVERRGFVRHAAVSIYTAGMSDPPNGTYNVGNAPSVGFSPRTCWQAAIALWDAKPEDC